LSLAALVGCSSASKPQQQPSDLDASVVDAEADASQPAADSGEMVGDAGTVQTDPPGDVAAISGSHQHTGHSAAGAAAGAGGNGAAGMVAAAGSGGDEAPVVNTPMVSEVVTTTLSQPSDLAWNPYASDELWIVNHGDDSTTIVSQASSASRSVQRRIDPGAAEHFMHLPTGLAFGGRDTTIVDAQGKPVIGTFATCAEDGENFMGPTLWTSDLRIYAIAKSDREPPFNSDATGAEGPGSHIDMLHRTPTCTGIAWEGSGNLYWTYSGSRAMLVRYDFGQDHGIGNDDHSDGSVWRYAISGISYVANVPSHMVYEPTRKLLYMADTGNSRVVSFDPSHVTGGAPMSANENVDGLQVALDMNGAAVTDLVPSSYGLKRPSGIELHGQYLYVSDNQTSTIHVFSLDGTPVGKYVISGVATGGLAGLAFGADGKLYFVDRVGSRVLRLDNPL
jgi:hypothetical protein